MALDGSMHHRYEVLLPAAVALRGRERAPDEEIAFGSSWNEWAGGNHLEPDARWGSAYLEATRRMIQGA